MKRRRGERPRAAPHLGMTCVSARRAAAIASRLSRAARSSSVSSFSSGSDDSPSAFAAEAFSPVLAESPDGRCALRERDLREDGGVRSTAVRS